MKKPVTRNQISVQSITLEEQDFSTRNALTMVSSGSSCGKSVVLKENKHMNVTKTQLARTFKSRKDPNFHHVFGPED